MFNTQNDLPLAVRENAVTLLQARLADSVDLFTQAKQAHWNVKGPNFIALHELFDSVAEVIEEHSDRLAERITALGGRADGAARTVAAQSQLDDFPLDAETSQQHVAAVARQLATFGKFVRANIDEATTLGDADTADIFTEVSRDVDRQLWLVEVHLQA